VTYADVVKLDKAFKGALKSGFSNYVNFRGRASRFEFWSWALFVIGVITVGARFDISTGYPVASSLWTLATLLPSLAFGARRLHDTGRSGFWLFLLVLPLIGIIPLFIWWCKKSTPDAGKYGADPLYDYLGDIFRIWTLSGLLQKHADGQKYVLSAFSSLFVVNGTEKPSERMRQYLNEAKTQASNALDNAPMSMFDFLEFDISGPYESLDIKESYFRLWKTACQAEGNHVEEMILVRLALSQSVTPTRQKQLIGSWNDLLRRDAALLAPP
jgi:uncharacterized membrane protein YhaH (DUF805 family)